MLGRFRLALALSGATALLLCGCMVSPARSNAGISIDSGKMLHLQQVLERYDANSNAVPQYLELWLTNGNKRCEELDASGNVLDVSLDMGASHIAYDASTLEAVKKTTSGVFLVDFESLRKAYPAISQQNEGDYAGRTCELYLLSNGNPDEWVKIYVDKQTGCVLFCDAPLFRLRTALLEELPLDNSLFSEPRGLVFKGGDGQ